MSILSEFKEFAVKGNVIDLAVGVIIGAAFLLWYGTLALRRRSFPHVSSSSSALRLARV